MEEKGKEKKKTKSKKTHPPVDEGVEDSQAAEGHEVHDDQEHPHDVDLLVVVVVAQPRRHVIEVAHVLADIALLGGWGGGGLVQ